MLDGLAITAAVAITAVVLGLVIGPLRLTLGELCGGLDRGDVWVALGGGCLVIGAFFNGTLAYSLVRTRFILAPPEAPQLALFHGVIVGLLIGLAIISAGVLVWTRRIRRGIVPAPRRQKV